MLEGCTDLCSALLFHGFRVPPPNFPKPEPTLLAWWGRGRVFGFLKFVMFFSQLFEDLGLVAQGVWD